VSSGAEIAVHKVQDSSFGTYRKCFAISSDGRALVTEWSDNSKGLWDLASGKIASVFPEVGIYRADFSPDGRRLVTVDGSMDGVADVWDAVAGKRLAILRHGSAVESAAFSPDGDTIVTATQDGVVRLWDAASGRELTTVGAHDGAQAVVFSPDGRTVATAAEDVRIWPVMPRGQALIDFACARVPWPLSAVQQERFGITDEWCTPEVSKALRAKLGMDGAPADGR
jgi:WD40 repeat protein